MDTSTASTTSTATVVAFTDVMCGWSTIAFHRFYLARRAAGLEGKLFLDPQLFLLEDVNQMALNTKIIEGEKPVVGALAEELEFKPWQRDPSEYPVTSLPANEAVHAAKEQSPTAAEQLDMALRLGFWRDSRCISMRHEILDIARGCPDVDADQLREALDDGRARGQMMRTYFDRREEVQGSPHFFLPDGSDIHNPGIEMHQVAEPGAGFLVLDSDDPSVYDDMVRRSAEAAGVN
ncbi:DsbA family protein [Citricoccus sp. GCM10030269]|uniref:DsbA family oxidoreductase n=1 Tax=Citricoccus sp. GCM10030269 TaxID=3273388 RepID=UPI00360B8BF9